MTNIFLDTLAGKLHATPPIWLMRQAGRYLPEYRAVRAQAGDFLSLCYSPKLATEVTLQAIRRFDFDAAILFSDILVVPHACGIAVSFVEGEGPKLEKLSQDQLLQPFDIQKLAPVYEAVSNIRAGLSSEKALIGFSGAPWTLMTYIAAGSGGDKQAAALNWLHQNPTTFHLNMDMLCEAIAQHCMAQIEAGAQTIQLFDSWAHALNEHDLLTCSVEPIRNIISKIHSKYPDIPVIIFPRGIAFENLKLFYTIGAQGISIGDSIQYSEIYAEKPQNIIFQGNLKPEILLENHNAIQEHVKIILNDNKNIPFIFNLGHGILPITPIENVHILIDAVRRGV